VQLACMSDFLLAIVNVYNKDVEYSNYRQ
jgi:hypothetical protein